MKIDAGQVAVITGGASGIGLALARRLGTLGVKLALGDIEQAALDAAVADLEQSGCEAIGLRVDVASETDFAAFRDATLARFGRVDIVCNNAGVVSAYRPFWETTAADWRWVLDVNLWGVVNGIRTFVPLLVAQGSGHVVNTASMAGLMTVPLNGPYNASKHAVISMSETLRLDLKNEGLAIGVTAVCPGLVETRIGDSGRNRPGGRDLGTARSRPSPQGAPVLTADDAARQIVAAIEANQLYLATNAGSAGPIGARVERVVRETAAPL